MVITRLKGGIGNQMFQYAAGKAIAEHHKTRLKIDLSFFEKNKQQLGEFISRSYELKIFPNIKEETTDYDFERMPKLLRQILQKIRFSQIKRYHEHSLAFNAEFFKITPPVLVDGYWQSEQYFKIYEQSIRMLFAFPPLEKSDRNTTLLAEIKNVSSISVHVRRGDYLNNIIFQHHGICSKEYYETAIDQMKQQYPNSIFYFFSDEPDWVKLELASMVDEFRIVEGNNAKNAWKDMLLMSNCKHHIIANSSFSWWGAWLNCNPKKTVIAPKNWYAKKELQEQTKHICPSTWVRI